jgi:hypothetical protein
VGAPITAAYGGRDAMPNASAPVGAPAAAATPATDDDARLRERLGRVVEQLRAERAPAAAAPWRAAGGSAAAPASADARDAGDAGDLSDVSDALAGGATYADAARRTATAGAIELPDAAASATSPAPSLAAAQALPSGAQILQLAQAAHAPQAVTRADARAAHAAQAPADETNAEGAQDATQDATGDAAHGAAHARGGARAQLGYAQAARGARAGERAGDAERHDAEPRDADARGAARRDGAARTARTVPNDVAVEAPASLAAGESPRAVATTAAPQPVAAPSGAESAGRVARALDARDAAPAPPMSHITLRLENLTGGEDRIRIGLRGVEVGASIDLADRATADRMRASVGELRDALDRRGLTADTVQISNGARSAAEATDAARAVAAGAAQAASASGHGAGAGGSSQSHQQHGQQHGQQQDARDGDRRNPGGRDPRHPSDSRDTRDDPRRPGSRRGRGR